jgi:hypothetical protein
MTEIASQRLHVIRTDFSGDSDAEAFDFYQAESLKLQFIPGSDWSNRVPMPDGGSCKMEAWLSADPDTLYINKTGTVDSATDRATIELARAETNFATGTYLYTVKVFDSGDTQTGVIASGQFTVKYSPDSDSVDYVGTTTYPVASDITYDNTTSELTATNVQTAIDELDAAIDQLEGTITITARNETGVQIDKGSVVYISGSTGNRSTVALADANIGATAQKTIGVAFANIAHNSDGDIVVLGELSGVDLSDFEDGDELYLSETPGGIANTPPAGDADWSYRIGYAETAQNNGKLLVAPQFRGTVYGANFFAATSASGVRTTLDVPSNSEAVLLTPDPDTTQDVSPASGFTALRLSADGAYMVLNRTAADAEAVFNFQDEGVGTWQVGLRRDPGNTPNPAPESNAFCVIDTQDASIPFWVSLVDKMVHAVTGLVSPIVKAASAAGIAFKDSTGTTQATIDSNGLEVDTLTASSGRIAAVEVNAQTGTTYTLVLGDAGKVVTMSNAAANTLTIPTNASVAYDVGTVINVEQIGVGSTTITASSGVTLNGVDAGSIEIGFQYGAVALRKDGTDAWVAQAAPQQSGQSATYTLLDTRTATMTGDETLTTTSAVYQFLDPDGSDRNLDLPDGTMFVLKNTGDNGSVITVRDASDVTIDEVDNGVTLTFRWDGSAWQVMG